MLSYNLHDASTFHSTHANNTKYGVKLKNLCNGTKENDNSKQ